jgi:hypothetical protein
LGTPQTPAFEIKVNQAIGGNYDETEFQQNRCGTQGSGGCNQHRAERTDKVPRRTDIQVGGYHIDKNGTLTGEYNTELVETLKVAGFTAEVELDEAEIYAEREMKRKAVFGTPMSSSLFSPVCARLAPVSLEYLLFLSTPTEKFTLTKYRSYAIICITLCTTLMFGSCRTINQQYRLSRR